jgi:hypothetical protein
MQKPGTMSQVKNGLRLAVLTLVFFGIAGLFFAGVNYAFFPTGHSRALGLVFLIISTSVMVVEMNRWVKVLPGILGFAVLNGLIMLFTGHLLNDSSIPISRLDALVITLFFLGSSQLSRTFKDRKLNVIDRVALLAFAFSVPLLIGFNSTREEVKGRSAPLDSIEFITMGIGLCCLLIAWVYERIQRRRSQDASGHHHLGGPAGSPADPI